MDAIKNAPEGAYQNTAADNQYTTTDNSTHIDQHNAVKLLDNFNCCFLKSGNLAKAPEGDEWQITPRTPNQYRGQGIGIICGSVESGVSVHCLDVDVKHPALSTEFKTWLDSFVAAKTGKILKRVGEPPKFLVPFICGDELKKAEFTSESYYPKGVEQIRENKNQLEVLGVGNQFVAYQIHPDTKQPYQWSGGELYDHQPDELLLLDKDDLKQIKEAFIRIAVSLGMVTKKKPKPEPITHQQYDTDLKGQPASEGQLQSYVDAIPNHGEGLDYDDWISIGMGIKYELGNAGFSMFDTFSRQSSKNDPEATRKKWDSFKGGSGNPVTGATVCAIAKQHNWKRKDVADEFDNLSFTADELDNINSMVNEILTVEPDMGEAKKVFSLSDFALNGRSHEMRLKMLEDVHILGELALLGQATAIYAKPNSGKTLLTMWLIIDAIKAGRVKAEDVFYINADDTHKGLTQKLELAEQYGFYMLAPGYNDFNASHFALYVKALTKNDNAHGKIIILDTLKKFTNLMDKNISSEFGKIAREFTSQGGSIIALAHVNKKRDEEGKVVFSGTSDITDDFDCYYTLDILTSDVVSNIRTVEFENHKNRGDVVNKAVYSYDCNPPTPYDKKLESVHKITAQEETEIKEQQVRDEILERNAESVAAIKDTIRGGITNRTELIKHAHELSGETKRKITKALDQHTGKNIAFNQFWNETRGEKNARIYALNWGV